MVKVICDTSFLIHIANTRIKNISSIDIEIGNLDFHVPTVVLREIQNLTHDEKKDKKSSSALEFIKKFKTIELSGNYADKAIYDYIKNNGGIAATMDKELKNKIKKCGGSIISISNNSIVLEK